ncbi:hypothetical protein Moror_15795 [Moniliophthora roreri MCA 2997]|uniref:Reverse transcriptase-rnase h-integrase n=2 Tax=Moniliophthora roreri TaxID=221103 RepID=V2WLP3_MONRO|nr:hypothetical protein Moror_15795 [Moniliophthora roreri MCA 2997]
MMMNTNSSTPRPDPPLLTATQLQDLDQICPEYRHLLIAEIKADRMQQESRASTLNPDSHQLSPTLQRPQPTPSDNSTERVPHIQMTVWDNEKENMDEEDNRDLHPERIFNNPTMWPMAWTEEVYAQLNALFARWEPTVPSTVKTTVVRFADNLWLGIYLKTATSDDGLAKLQDQTIPSAIELLTSILQDLTMMTISTGTVNNNANDNEDPGGQTQFVEGRDMYVLDNSGTRIVPAEFVGEWISRGVISSNLEVQV